MTSDNMITSRSLAKALNHLHLAACAKDAIDWQRTGSLVEGPLQAFAHRLVQDAGLDESTSLQHAEAAVLREVAERFITAVEGAAERAQKPLHPEQRTGEIHLCNLEMAGARVIGWKTKRVGEVAYDVDGIPVPSKVPVFIDAQELIAAGQWTDQYVIKE